MIVITEAFLGLFLSQDVLKKGLNGHRLCSGSKRYDDGTEDGIDVILGMRDKLGEDDGYKVRLGT